jgi:hypothetical protein
VRRGGGGGVPGGNLGRFWRGVDLTASRIGLQAHVARHRLPVHAQLVGYPAEGPATPPQRHDRRLQGHLGHVCHPPRLLSETTVEGKTPLPRGGRFRSDRSWPVLGDRSHPPGAWPKHATTAGCPSSLWGGQQERPRLVNGHRGLCAPTDQPYNRWHAVCWVPPICGPDAGRSAGKARRDRSKEVYSWQGVTEASSEGPTAAGPTRGTTAIGPPACMVLSERQSRQLIGCW